MIEVPRWALGVTPARSSPSPSTAVPDRPLVVCGDEELLDDLLRLLAAAGAEPQRAAGGPELRRAYRQTPLVLVGADALATGRLHDLPRRPGVVIVSGGELPAAEWAAAVALGAERVAVLPQDEAWLVARAAQAIRVPVERGRLIAVGASCGGAGASTLATALALAGDPGGLLVDGDPWGGGLDLLLGAERVDGLRWPDLTGLRGRVDGEALLAALPVAGGVHVLAASRSVPVAVPEHALDAVVAAARAAGTGAVVDVGRPRPSGWGEGVLADADLAVLVVPARLRAVTAARLLVEAPGTSWGAAQLVLRPVAGGLSREEVADVVGRPVLAELRHDRTAVSRGESGAPPDLAPRSALGQVTRRLLSAAQGARR